MVFSIESDNLEMHHAQIYLFNLETVTVTI